MSALLVATFEGHSVNRAHRALPTGRHLLFLAMLMSWSLLPSRMVPWLQVGDLRINFNDALLVVVAVLSSLLAQSNRSSRSTSAARRNSFPVTFWILLGYASISLLWSEVNGLDTVAMAWTIALAAAAAVVGNSLARNTEPHDTSRFLWWLTVAVGAVSALYFIESFFSLGLRSAESTLWTDFGIQRIRGPLYGASVGQFILLPALGCGLDRMVTRRGSRIAAGALVLILCTCILGLGSRSALIGLGVFALAALARGRAKAKLIFALAAPVILAVAVFIVFSRASSDRLLSWEDTARQSTYETALTMFRAAPPALKIFGAGYGARWPWYLTDVTPGALDTGGLYMRSTPYGITAYHPHSTILLIGVELGLVGLTLAVLTLLWLARTINSNIRSRTCPFLSIGLIASLVTCCVDLTFFKGGQVNTVWWVYACGSAGLIQMKLRMRQPSQAAASALSP
jgi:O-antigen ligase